MATGTVAKERRPMGVTTGGRDRDATTATATTNGAAPTRRPLGACPKCDRVYGQRRRCYTCSPNPGRLGRKGATARDAARRASRGEAGPAPSSLDREIQATQAIAEALGGLDAASARRVLAWVAAHFGEAS